MQTIKTLKLRDGTLISLSEGKPLRGVIEQHKHALAGVNLAGADLFGATLCGANLAGADLFRADLRGADLCGADLAGANLPPYALVPEEGSFIGWKKLAGNVVAKLGIPNESARTSSLVGRKNRADFVKVLALSSGAEGVSLFDGNVVYRVNETVYADSFDPDIRVECSHGIHFFITKKEAEDFSM